MKRAILLLVLLLAVAPVASATTKTQDAEMAACLKFAHAKNVEQYCAGKRGTKTQQACVTKAETTGAKRACLVPAAAK